MKIGIITFWDSQDNYGQLLQCYALQKHLKNAGHSPFLIRFLPYNRKSWVEKLSVFRKIFSLNHIRAYLKFLNDTKRYTQFNQSYPRNFDAFRNEFLEVTPKIYHSFDELWKEKWDADAFICGSDQIWTYSSNKDKLRAYFLDFVPLKAKCIAYAASFGRTVLPADYGNLLPLWLRKFTAVGLREQSGVELCKNALRNDAKLVCDPTLLLTANEYVSSILKKETETKNTVFCYLLNWETELPAEDIKTFISYKNMEINFFPAHGAGNENSFIPTSDLSIPSWLNAIAASQYIFTNSFHGTVFSILFRRPFVTFALKGDSKGMNDRLTTLLKITGLENRLYFSGGSLDKILDTPIDWNDVDARLNVFRNQSIAFLNNALDKSQNEIKKKFNICFQTYGEVNHNYGGLDRVTEILADYFTCQGASVYYLSQLRRTDIANERQYFLPNRNKLKSKENIEYYNRFLQEKNIDILINQEGNVNISLPIVNKKILYITTLHFNPDYITDNHFERKFQTSFYPVFVKNILLALFRVAFVKKAALVYLRNKLSRNYQFHIKNSDAFVLLSDLFKKDLLRLTNPPVVFQNVYAINNPALLLPKEIDVRNKQKKLLYAGRLECGMKRLDILLKNWASIANDFKDWSLWLVGDGPDRKILEKQVKGNSIPRVYFEGMQNPQKYYEESAIFCFSSNKSEGWGMVLVEAQAMGCVPIGFNSYSAIYDIIEDGKTGMIVPAFDNEKYIAVLKELMTDETKRNNMAHNAVANAQRFDIEHIGQQWFKLFDMVKKL
jgi:glycosyltransferase involved in cell wall biosynthesis